MQINSIAPTSNFGARLSTEVESQLKQAVYSALTKYPNENHAQLYDDIKTIRKLFPDGAIYFRTKIDHKNFRGAVSFIPTYILTLSRPGKTDVMLPIFKDSYSKDIPIRGVQEIANELKKIQAYDETKEKIPLKIEVEKKIKELFA